jgi:hypothetical protein
MKTKFFWPIALFILFSACNADKEVTETQPTVKETATEKALSHEAFTHTATNLNISGSYTIISHAATNNQPNVILIVTHFWGINGPAYNKAYTVRYLNGRWRIGNVDGTPMSINQKFHVLVAYQSPGNNAYVHAGPTSGVYTILNHPLLNNNPNAQFLITQRFTGASPLVNRPLGVRYSAGRWRIYALGAGASMPANTWFNVYIDPHIFIPLVGTYASNKFRINSTYTNNGPLRHIFITHNLNYPSWNPNYVGVQYINANNQWIIYNENGTVFPVGSRYFVLSTH